MSQSRKPLALLVGAAVAAGSLFSMDTLAHGYMQDARPAAAKAGEGKCGEGKCGEGKCGGDKAAKEGSCGEEAKAGHEGKCGGEKAE